MRIIVTGGSGFLGAQLIPKLCAVGHEVLALARSETAALSVRKLGAQAIFGDLSRGDLILPTVDAIVHAAAHFRLAGPRKPFFETNVDGAKRLLAQAKSAGIGRVIFVSAAAVVMDDNGMPLLNVDETVPVFANSFSAYIASKAQAEQLICKAHGPDLATFALRPPAIWGAGDMFSQALPKMVRNRLFGFIDRGDYPYVTCHVENVVQAILCAAAAAPAEGGRAYFVNDPEPTTFRAFASGIADALGLDVQRAPSMSYGVAWAVGSTMEGGWSALGRKDDPPFSRTMVRLIGRPFVTSDQAARDHLGYAPTRTRQVGLAGYKALTRQKARGVQR